MQILDRGPSAEAWDDARVRLLEALGVERDDDEHPWMPSPWAPIEQSQASKMVVDQAGEPICAHHYVNQRMTINVYTRATRVSWHCVACGVEMGSP